MILLHSDIIKQCTLLHSMSTKIEEYWYTSLDNLAQLAKYIVNKEGHKSLDIVYFLEKPWKWEKEWNEYQINMHIDNDLDAFDRRDK